MSISPEGLYLDLGFNFMDRKTSCLQNALILGAPKIFSHETAQQGCSAPYQTTTIWDTVVPWSTKG